MSEYDMKKFEKEVADMPLDDEQDFLAWLPLASRLAAMGETGQFDRCRELVTKFEGRLEEALVERSLEGVWDLRHAIGEQLGHSVIEAQDYSCFLKLVSGEDLVSGATLERLEGWVEEVDETPLEQDAVEIIQLFRSRFSLPEKYRIASINPPFSTLDEALLASLAPSVKIVEDRWDKEEASSGKLEPLLAAYEDHPSGNLKHHFQRREVPFTIDGNTFEMSRTLTDDWKVWIEIEPDKASGFPDVDSVRLGSFPAEKEKGGAGDTERWAIDLQYLDDMNKWKILNREVVLIFSNQDRFKVD